MRTLYFYIHRFILMWFTRTDDDMADSFCLVRSDTESSVSVLRKENAAYKTKLEEMQQQLVSAERMLKMRHDQDQQLRESIILARKEVWFLSPGSYSDPSLHI